MSATASSATAMEEEWEEEEQLVVAELSGMISSDLISSRQQGACKIVDIDSEQPMMQLGRYLFAGEYEDAIGTCVIFEEDAAGSASALKYKCHTMKKLMLQRTFLSERKEDEPVSNRIELLALHEEESLGRKSAVCRYLDPRDTEKSESKDCEDPETSDESADEMEETQTLENSAEETMNPSSCSQLISTQEEDDGS